MTLELSQIATLNHHGHQDHCSQENAQEDDDFRREVLNAHLDQKVGQTPNETKAEEQDRTAFSHDGTLGEWIQVSFSAMCWCWETHLPSKVPKESSLRVTPGCFLMLLQANWLYVLESL